MDGVLLDKIPASLAVDVFVVPIMTVSFVVDEKRGVPWQDCAARRGTISSIAALSSLVRGKAR